MVRGNDGPYGSPVDGFTDKGEVVPYGEPRTLMQIIKKIEGSNGFD